MGGEHLLESIAIGVPFAVAAAVATGRRSRKRVLALALRIVAAFVVGLLAPYLILTAAGTIITLTHHQPGLQDLKPPGT